jgi:hypothetical protein
MLKYSTGLRNALLSKKAEIKGAIVGTGLAFVDGGESADSITDSGNGFIDAGFAPGDLLFVQGATTSGNDDDITGAVILTVAAGTITFASGTVNTDEGGAAGTVVAVCQGGSLRDLMKDGEIWVYSGSRPSSPDDAMTGTLLLKFTESAGTLTPGAFDNGIELDDAADGVINKPSSETWQGTAVASGVASHFLWVANAADNALASTTLYRVSGSIGSSNADMVFGTTDIVSGRTYTLDDFPITFPEYYGA